MGQPAFFRKPGGGARFGLRPCREHFVLRHLPRGQTTVFNGIVTRFQIPPAFSLHEVESAPSAAGEAVRLARGGAGEGTLVFAHEESDSRGRFDSPWVTAPGNLHCAVIVHPDLPAEEAAGFGLVALVSLGAAIAELVSPMVSLRYRWPNDLILNAGKAGGVWLDAPADSADPMPWLVVAARVNVASYPPEPAIAARSIWEIEGDSAITACDLLGIYARHLLRGFDRWSEDGLGPALRAFAQRLDGIGEPATVRLAGGDATGTLAEIDAAGAARITTTSGECRRVGLDEFYGFGPPR